MGLSQVHAAWIATLAAAGCNVSVPDLSGTSFACGAVEPRCPEAQTCVRGVCRAPGFQRRLGFDASTITEDLVDFPVMLKLDATRVDYARAGQEGAELAFVTDEGEALAHEIETWDPEGTSVVWVRVPRIGAGSTTEGIWMQHAPLDEAPGSVWSAGFRGVWHLAESPADPGPQIKDSSGANNHGTVSLGMSTSGRVAGQIGSALEFDGIDDWVVVPHHASLDLGGQAITLSAWVRLSAPSTVDAGVVVKSTENDYNYQLGVQSVQVGNFRVLTDAGSTYLSGGTLLETGRWYYLAGVYDGTTSRVYIDGVEDGSDPNTGDLVGTIEPLLIGRRALADDRFFNGRIDEVRVAAAVRSAAWLLAEVRSMTDQLVLYDAMP